MPVCTLQSCIQPVGRCRVRLQAVDVCPHGRIQCCFCCAAGDLTRQQCMQSTAAAATTSTYSRGSTGLWGYQASDQLHASCGGCCALFQTMHNLAWALSQGTSRGRRTDLAVGVAGSSDHQGSRRPGATAETERPVLRKGSSPFVRGNLESLGQAARRPRVTSHPHQPVSGTPHAVSAFRRSQHQ